MKSKFICATSILMGAFAMASFTACSSDDDKGNDSNATAGLAYPSPILVDTNGNRVFVSSISELGYDAYSDWAWTYEYDNEDNLAGYSCVTVFDAVVGNSTIVYKGGLPYSGEQEVVEIETNRDGLISKMREEQKYDSNRKEIIETSFTYNSEKQLLKMSQKWNYKTYDEENDCWNIDDSDVYVYEVSNTWENGNLVKWEETYTYFDGDVEDVEDVNTYTLTYGTQKNPVKQYPASFLDDPLVSTGIEIPLFFMGFMGVGPAYLPTSVISTFNDKSMGYFYSDATQYSFQLNSNGTIKTETAIDKDGWTSEWVWQYGKTNRSNAAPTRSISTMMNDRMNKRDSRHKRHHRQS